MVMGGIGLDGETAAAESTANEELNAVRQQMQMAQEAIKTSIHDEPEIAATVIDNVAYQQSLDRTVVQKSMLALVRAGEAQLDQDFRISLVS